jgi:hypothetical protein
MAAALNRVEEVRDASAIAEGQFAANCPFAA